MSIESHRPRTRADCKNGIRPCPWVSCKYHLYIDVTHTGRIIFNFPDLEVWELENSCALDIADQGVHDFQQIGQFLNKCRELIRQVENKTHKRLRRRLRDWKRLPEIYTKINIDRFEKTGGYYG